VLAGARPAVTGWSMAYFLEYLVPAESGGADLPVDDANDGSVPVSETAGRVVHVDALPARSRIAADSLEAARTEAEQLLQHSKADTGELFEDSGDSLESGAGRRVGRFREGSGWSED
jgi:ABC-type sugar transport system substrate-binding protein